ncbi:MAG: cupredoxin family protein [Ramlibacter sp.]|nr:cupredoxin family protein [Ramlibacter sp.]
MRRLNALLAAALLGVSLAAAAHQGEAHGKKAGPVVKEQKEWGIAGDAKAVTRVVQVVMTDHMRFTPDRLEVRQGETVRFVHKNAGKVMHEFVLGTTKTNDEHAAMMLKFPGMEHDEPYMAHVGPGKTAEMIWTFNRAGEFDFACLIAGHYQAGMVGRIKVIPAGEGLAKDQKATSPSARRG